MSSWRCGSIGPMLYPLGTSSFSHVPYRLPNPRVPSRRMGASGLFRINRRRAEETASGAARRHDGAGGWETARSMNIIGEL